MKTAKPADANKPHGLWVAALLAVVLFSLFGKSFLPGYVHFSNDGPLGAVSAKYIQLPAAFTGSWVDLGTIGGSSGSCPFGPTALLRWGLGPVGFAKFFAPLALFILGLGAWTFFRQLRLSALAATLGMLATVLSSTFFATACWGVGSQEIAIGMDFFALALVVSNSPPTPALIRWARLALAGLAVGMNVTEAADIGAIFSLFISIFVLFRALTEEGVPVAVKLGRGLGRVAIIAAFAGFIATQTVVSLVGSQITGIAGTAQDAETKAQHWDWATQWSEPKIETLGLFVPGLFGYRTDTPNNMMEFLQDGYKGGNYWGGVGRDPALDRYFDSGRTGPAPAGFMRFTGGGNYCGILVVLLALWTAAQSLRRRDGIFPESQRRLIWFWTVVLIGSLLLAYGRFAPFYKFLYMLPYFSTIRNPTKFLIVVSWAIVILFAYGIHGLSRRYLEVSATNSTSRSAQLKNWWAKASSFNRNWTWFCIFLFVGSVLAGLVYASEKPSLVRYLQKVGFGNEEMAKLIVTFSIEQVGWFIVLFALSAGLCVLVIAGIFSGKYARLGGFLLGFLLVVDLGRANLPYIIHWNYMQKYDIDPSNSTNSINPIINFLRDKPYEHRVTGLPFNLPQQFLPFEELYKIEWMQHQFPYYNVQSLDVIQMPRMPADLEAFERALIVRNTPDSVQLIARRWQLTNTRYLLGPAGFLDVMNEQLDPAQHRFRMVATFDVVPKSDVPLPPDLTREQLDQVTHMLLPDKLTAKPMENGNYALFEFTGALPRAKLYSHWQISTNDNATLQTLASTNFDAWQTVLVSSPLPIIPAPNTTNENSGTVEFKSYAPKDIVFDAKANAPSVLLLNDKFDPNWQVLVDGKPTELLRCNFIMRGVYLPTGPHTVEFKFALPNSPLYVSLTAIGIGMLLCGFLIFAGRRHQTPATQP